VKSCSVWGGSKKQKENPDPLPKRKKNRLGGSGGWIAGKAEERGRMDCGVGFTGKRQTRKYGRTRELNKEKL